MFLFLQINFIKIAVFELFSPTPVYDVQLQEVPMKYYMYATAI